MPAEEWPVLEKVLEEALGKLQSIRQRRSSDGGGVRSLRQAIAGQLAPHSRKAPQVGNAYRERLFERIRTILSDTMSKSTVVDLIKEVARFWPSGATSRRGGAAG